LKTTNGGVNWFEQLLPSSGYYDVKFKSQDTAYALDNIALVRTTNKGDNWAEYSYTGGAPKTFSFPNFDTIYTGGYWGEIRRSIDAGLNWSLMHSDSSKSVRDIFFINTKTGWFTGDAGMIKKTTNAGLNWQTQNSNVGNVLRKIHFINENTGWIVGDSGTVLKTTTGGTTFINSINTELPNSFRLYQNYPNPFNPKSNIKFQIAKISNVKLSIFDITGKEVNVLVNERMQPGSYEVSFDGSNLSSGVYFYSLTAGDFNETKKMLMIK
jgi:photosystem II stability/assembly factor-like uncharacterized protein